MKQLLRLGRDPSNDLVFEQKRISRQHCQLKKVPEGLLVEDLESTWGTFLNGKRVAQCLLKPEDTLSLGQVQELDVRLVLTLFEEPAHKFPFTYAQLLAEKVKEEKRKAEEIDISSLSHIPERYDKEFEALKKRNKTYEMGGILLPIVLMIISLLVLPASMKAYSSILVPMAFGIRQLISMNGKSQLEALKKFYQNQYACPRCDHQFALSRSYNSIKARGKCVNCGARWKTD